MPGGVSRQDTENAQIVLGLLESVERDGAQSQRKLASELGIALGLVNAYLKRCVKKGLVKMSEAPTRRYAYYLTPQGFSEKSKLTVEYLSLSFSFFRQARADCAEVLAAAQARGWSRIVVAGVSDLGEIVQISALESGMTIVAVVDGKAMIGELFGLPVAKSFDAVTVPFDAIVIADLNTAYETFAAAAERVGADRVFVPKLLGLAPLRVRESV